MKWYNLLKTERMGLITIRTFDNSFEAHLLKCKLENEGIPCYIFDENTVSINPLYNITVGGIKLKINQADADKALEIINDVEEAKLTDDNNEVIKCPNCGSEEYYTGFKSMKGIKGFLSIIVSFLLVVFPIYYKTLNKCKSCGHEFNSSEK